MTRLIGLHRINKYLTIAALIWGGVAYIYQLQVVQSYLIHLSSTWNDKLRNEFHFEEKKNNEDIFVQSK